MRDKLHSIQWDLRERCFTQTIEDPYIKQCISEKARILMSAPLKGVLIPEKREMEVVYPQWVLERLSWLNIEIGIRTEIIREAFVKLGLRYESKDNEDTK